MLAPLTDIAADAIVADVRRKGLADEGAQATLRRALTPENDNADHVYVRLVDAVTRVEQGRADLARERMQSALGIARAW